MTGEESGSLVIRLFEPTDQAQVQELILSGLEEHWGVRDRRKNPDLRNIASSYANATFLVACDNDHVVGTGALVPTSDGIGEIRRMSVAVTHRRKGIGRVILTALLQDARNRALDTVILETTEAWHQVIQFYLAHRFRITHHADGNVWFSLTLKKDLHAPAPRER